MTHLTSPEANYPVSSPTRSANAALSIPSNELAAMVAAAKAAGKCTVIPAGVTAIERQQKTDKPVKFRPEHCGNSINIKGHKPTLSILDGDWS